MCSLAANVKTLIRFRIDDACDVWAVHGIGGWVGNILTGIFASNAVITMGGDAAVATGAGWVDGHFVQIGYQLAASVSASAWSFVMTFILLQVLGLVFQMRLTPLEEELGCDLVETGENACKSFGFYLD